MIGRLVGNRCALGWGLVGAFACGGQVDMGDDGIGSSASREGGVATQTTRPDEPRMAEVSAPASSGMDEPAPDPPRESAEPASACGNGRLDRDEVCDGRLFGGETCASVTMGTLPDGHLNCTAWCTFEMSDCWNERESRPSTGGSPGAGGTTGTSASDAGTGGTGGTNGGSFGEPHLLTLDGVAYDFQAVGEFVLLEDATDPSFVIQVRQAPYRDFRGLSVNVAVAAQVGGSRVVVEAGDPPTVRIDGVPEPVAESLDVPGGGRVVRVDDTLGISWSTGEWLWINGTFSKLLNVTYSADPASRRALRGLLGNDDGNPHNDFSTRAGLVLSSPPGRVDLYRVFGESWRVSQSESLFDYERGQSTATFSDPGFPYTNDAPPEPTPAQVEAAREACRSRGVTGAFRLAACAFDLALTGEIGFAEAATHPSPLQDVDSRVRPADWAATQQRR